MEDVAEGGCARRTWALCPWALLLQLQRLLCLVLSSIHSLIKHLFISHFVPDAVLSDGIQRETCAREHTHTHARAQAHTSLGFTHKDAGNTL